LRGRPSDQHDLNDLNVLTFIQPSPLFRGFFYFQVCPFLLRIFPRKRSHHRLEAFERSDRLPEQEVQVHTWQDASLRELCDLLQDVNPDAKRPNARISFSLVYPDRTGRNTMRNVGVVHATRPSNDDDATLRDLKFQTGDYMSVAVTEF
jgi:histone deacetylase complex subunit SAP18